MRRTLIIEATIKTEFDEELTQMWEGLTEEQRAESLAETDNSVRRMFDRETDEDAEINVNVRIEEGAE